MSTSMRRYSPKHHEKAKAEKKALFLCEIDQRYFDDPRDQMCYQFIGTMTPERAKRLFALLNERDVEQQKEQP